MNPASAAFLEARPVWPKGRELEKNLFVGFRAEFELGGNVRDAALRITGHSLYRIYANGEFVGHGPARAGHGWYRVDEWDIARFVRAGKNIVSIEVAGYNANSYYLIDQPSFLQAEVVAEGKVLASTGAEKSGFSSVILPQRIQRVQRTSFQRPFSEAYRLGADWNDRRTTAKTVSPAELATTDAKQLLPRGVPYPRFSKIAPQRVLKTGSITVDHEKTDFWSDRSLTAIGPKLKGFPEAELEIVLSRELQKVKIVDQTTAGADTRFTEPYPANSFRLLDFGKNLTGFLGARIHCTTNTRLLMSFDEILSNGDVNPLRLGMVNGVLWDMQPGTYELESFEPYTLRFLKLDVIGGAADIQDLYLREYANDDCRQATFACSDTRLNRIFEAGVQTFRQNSTDVFMDCPSRERAGWLCDSFFTARAAMDLCPTASVESNFLENFAVAEKFEALPDGMLPMCYPADHYDGVFIPNWALWFVVQLEEYVKRTGDTALAARLEPRVMKLFDYFKGFRNSDGLLEKLTGWIFIEWSKANDFLQDVSYATNMLYAGALDAAGRLYAKPQMSADAARVRETVLRQSFDGEFFVDNAVRKDGKLERTTNRTEACQYYAFFFDVATTAAHGALWNRLAREFGPHHGSASGVHPANSFIGYTLRMELAARLGSVDNLISDAVGLHARMVDMTGTLWENKEPGASCNHGFASHVVHLLYRDLLGLRIDRVNKRVSISIPETSITWCEGRIPVPEGFVSLRWWKEDGAVKQEFSAPAGYSISQ